MQGPVHLRLLQVEGEPEDPKMSNLTKIFPEQLTPGQARVPADGSWLQHEEELVFRPQELLNRLHITVCLRYFNKNPAYGRH